MEVMVQSTVARFFMAHGVYLCDHCKNDDSHTLCKSVPGVHMIKNRMCILCEY